MNLRAPKTMMFCHKKPQKVILRQAQDEAKKDYILLCIFDPPQSGFVANWLMKYSFLIHYFRDPKFPHGFYHGLNIFARRARRNRRTVRHHKTPR